MLHTSGARLAAGFLGLVGMFAIATFSQSPAAAAEEKEISIELKDHKFAPDEIKVPVDTPIKLTVKNSDASPEEFESHPLGVEKVIAGNASATIRLKPLAKGSYKFVGEYNEDTAKGTIIAE
jgi:plastocyanin